MGPRRAHLFLSLAAILIATALVPNNANARKPSAKPNPSYLLQIQPLMLETGVKTEHGVPLATALHSRLGESSALTLRYADEEPLPKNTLRRHLSRLRLAGLSAVPTANCKVSMQGDRTVVSCTVKLLLMTLRLQNLISAYSCEAQVESRRPSTSLAFIDGMRRDVLAAAAEGVAEDLIKFLEGNRPGTGRLPRRGR